ncbi:GNAT family N-acetyltransferase [Oribacterium sp. WCC10]|uniref:GNAT family N-acetyltransferase n=1 Tax=Oribacterium sp. WCC10 TaxID=1855343 RepID=UPI0008F1F697|nr:GNAT family N-acetyltransferase [Oribacterium sp. WCC10]SFG78705.1 N-acetylglutamate synthase, GNAT family [Oribacterium sp. WCC10]
MSISDNVRIRKANKSDLDAVVNIYDEIHKTEEEGIISVGWIRGIYPVKETAEEALKREDLFIIEKDGIVLGSGIINKIQVDVYKKTKWEHEAEDDKVCVLHTLTISPMAGKQGLGKEFIKFYENYALENGCSELRIDTNERNMAARKMYSKLGYKEVAIVPTVFNGIPDVNLVLLEKYLGQNA